MTTAKTTLNPACGQLAIGLQGRWRLDDPISFKDLKFATGTAEIGSSPRVIANTLRKLSRSVGSVSDGSACIRDQEGGKDHLKPLRDSRVRPDEPAPQVLPAHAHLALRRRRSSPA